MPSIINLPTTAALNAKINEAKNKIPNITKLATNTALTAVENELPDHSTYIISPECNKLINSRKFYCKVETSKFSDKRRYCWFCKKKEDFDDKLKILNKKFTSNKSKHLLVENEL